MSTAVPSSATSASGARDSSRGSTASVPLRRAPVLLSLPALHAPSPAPAPLSEEPPTAEQRTSRKGSRHAEEPAVEESGAHEEVERREHHRHEKHSAPSRHGRSSRRQPRQETPTRPALSQWLLGGGMLAAGVIGFFVLSGDFGGDPSDAPQADGWSKQDDSAAASGPSFNEPQFAETPAVTVHRETPTPAAGERTWSNPAEGEIAHAPAEPSTPAMPNWMSGGAMPSAPQGSEKPKETVSAPQTAADRHAAQPVAHETQDSLNLAPPLNPTPAAPAFHYPSTGAAGLSSPTPAPPPTAQSPYPTTGYGAGPSSYSAPAYGPAARTGMRDPGPPAYPTTGASQGPFPNDVTPPAMSPRYERIR